MYYKKKGIPEEGELLLCTVKKVLHNSVFVSLDEFVGKEGLIHISEIAAGRIRNIRDYVRENKKIVCKVLRVDKIKGHIDLSLRRVSLQSKKNKETESMLEERAEKILESVAKKLNKTIKDAYEIAGDKIIENYGLLNAFFIKVVEDNSLLTNLQIEKTFEKELLTIIKEKIKPPEVSITRKVKLYSLEPSGITEIKNILSNALEYAKEKGIRLAIKYASAPAYSIKIIAKNYKDAEDGLKNIIGIISSASKKLKIKFSSEQHEN